MPGTAPEDSVKRSGPRLFTGRRPWVVLVTLAAIVAGMPVAEAHSGFHEYATFIENNNAGSFIGNSAEFPHANVDTNVSVALHPGQCTQPILGHPVYQPLWLRTSAGLPGPGDSSWVEVGIGHQCQTSFKYEYWGYAISGSFWLTGWRTVTAGTAKHRYTVSYNGNTNKWRWYIDGAKMGTVPATYIGQTGVKLTVGYETYAVFAETPKVTASLFREKINVWSPWESRDHHNLTDPIPCGAWVSDVSGWYAQGNACP